jgi:MerR family transcriptional regulator, light-induced transcriptional regulator
MSEMMVSAGEAARRLGVAPATIQRWVDNGVLHAERTPGGHRRIYVTELRRLIAASRPAELSGPLAAWFDVLMTGDPVKVKAALLASRRKTGSWAETADEVASTLAEIGRSWEAGVCRIFEEHAATEALRRAAAACAAEIPCPDDAPRAALLTIEHERHTLGLALAELVLAEAGWRPLWIGEGPPAGELAPLLAKFKPQAVVVSASPASRPAAVARYQTPLTTAAQDAGLKLVLAGGGAWKDSGHATRVLAFKELREALA